VLGSPSGIDDPALDELWSPLAAVLTPANVAESEPVADVPAEVRFALGDRHYKTPDLREDCDLRDRLLVATRYGKYPHSDDGVEVRRIFYKLRSTASENFNEHFKGVTCVVVYLHSMLRPISVTHPCLRHPKTVCLSDVFSSFFFYSRDRKSKILQTQSWELQNCSHEL
jgi:hypothetical protein